MALLALMVVVMIKASDEVSIPILASLTNAIIAEKKILGLEHELYY